MGKNSRIAELEAQLELERSYWKAKWHLGEEVFDYIKTLAEMPEEAVLHYRIGGQEVVHEVGKSARILFEKICANSLRPTA